MSAIDRESGRCLRRTFLFSSVLLWTLTARSADNMSLDAQLSFDSLYKSVGVLGTQYSERAKLLKGKVIRMRGYMAPPLKPESRFFVLTREPVAVCPFCSSDAQWPSDIVVIYLKATLGPVDFTQRIEVTGKLEMDSWTDPETGFVSQVRIVDAGVSTL